MAYLKGIAQKMNVDIPNTIGFYGSINYSGMSNFPPLSPAAAQQPVLNTAADVNINPSAANWSTAASVASANTSNAPTPQVEAVTSLDSLIG